MATLGILNLSPNAGAKTVSANLAYEMSSEANPSIAIDTCASNLLRLHFGMPLFDERGAGSSLAHVFVHPSSLHFLPFGLQGEQEKHPLTATAVTSLKETITTHFDAYHDHIVHLGSVPYSRWSLLESQFDMVLCVIEPQPLTYAHLHQLSKYLGSVPNNFKFIINKVQFSQTLNQNITQLIRFELSESLVSPVLIRYDQNIPEALATQQPVNDYAPESQGAADFQALTLWIRTLL